MIAKEEKLPFEEDVEDRKYEVDLLGKIQQAERKVLEKEMVVSEIKEDLKYAKANMDEAIDSLRKLCREGMKELPLFDQDKSDGFEELLRETLLSECLFRFLVTGFNPAKKMAVSDQFPTCFDFTKRDPDWWNNVKGVGEKMAEEIEDCFDDHLITMRNEFYSETEDSKEITDEQRKKLDDI